MVTTLIGRSFFPRAPRVVLGIALVCGGGFATSVASAQNLLINGSFETNTADVTILNPSNAVFNSLMSSVTAFGGREGIDIQTVSGGFGAPPQSGLWKVSPASDAGGVSEAFSFDLTGSLVAGRTYDLSFYIERLAAGTFSGGRAEIGVSTSSTSFGSMVFTSALSVPGWTLQSTSFVSPIDATHLTVRVDTTANRWIGLDNFTLTPVADACEADFNNDDVVNSQDFFDFLTAFFASAPNADFNADMVINSQDFFDFLTAFFEGC